MRDKRKNTNCGHNACIIQLVAAMFLLLVPFLLSAQTVSIVGKTNKANALVRLMSYNEMFTLEQKTIATTHSDADGKFVLNADIQCITPAQIAVNLDRVEVVLNKGGKYDIEIFVPDKNPNVSYYEQEKPSLKINSADDGGLSRQLIDAEALINDFVFENMNAIYRSRKAYLLDTLQNKLDMMLGAKTQPFVNDFVRYKLAALRMPLMSGGAKKMIAQYFDNQPVLYSQSAYIDIFNEIFEGYFSTREFDQAELKNALYSGYDSFRTYLNKNTLLANNQQLAELILVKYLYRIYYESSDMRIIAKDYLNKLKNSSKYLEIRTVATDLLAKLARLSYDSEAPDFALNDKDGKIVKLADYQDDMLLLQFVDQVSPMTDYQFALLNDLQRQMTDTITVVTIATKESFADFVQMFENKGFKWQILNLGDDILLLEKYNIRTCPDYVILKPKGRIGMAPAPSPERYLDYHIRRIFGYK